MSGKLLKRTTSGGSIAVRYATEDVAAAAAARGTLDAESMELAL